MYAKKQQERNNNKRFKSLKFYFLRKYIDISENNHIMTSIEQGMIEARLSSVAS